MKPTETTYNASIVWNEMVLVFLLISSCLDWKVGNLVTMRIGVDRWVGYGSDFRMPKNLIDLLDEQGI
jgi:hypothetical protein